MNKAVITKFIDKYHLGGNIESVKWETDGDGLKTSFISENRSMLGEVTLSKFPFEKLEFGLYTTSHLKKLLDVLDSDIELDKSKADDKVFSLHAQDKKSKVTFMCSDLSVIPTPPPLKQLPEFEVEVNLDSEFITRFTKGKSALPDVTTFTIDCKDGAATLIIGYTSVASNQVKFTIDTKEYKDIGKVSFSSGLFNEVLKANRGAKTSTMKVASNGLAHVSFTDGEYTSDYYFVAVDEAN